MERLKRNTFIRIFFLIIVLSSLVSYQGGNIYGSRDAAVLARVDAAGGLLQLGLPVYAHLQGRSGNDYALVKATVAQLKQSRAQYRILDPSAYKSGYLVLSMFPLNEPVPRAGLKHILWDDGIHLIVRAGAANRRHLLGSHISVKPLEKHPIVIKTAAQLPQSRTLAVDYNTTIQQMMDQILQANVSTHINDLTGENIVQIGGSPYTIASRHTSSPHIEKATQYVYETLQGFGLSVSYHNWNDGGYSGRNVIAQLTGTTNPDEIVMVTAHLDSMPSGSINYGADDNGSGSVGVMMCAQFMSQHQFKRTIRFALWTGEEQWLLGSNAYSDMVYANGDNIVAVYNMDMIGWDGSGGPDLRLHTRTTSNPGYAADLAIANTFIDVVNAYSMSSLLTPILDPDGITQSDHSSFWDNGYPGILGIEDDQNDITPHYHTTSDRASTLNMAYFTNFIKASLGTAAYLAILDEGVNPLPPVAQFSASTTTPGIGDTVTFTDQSSNVPTTWSWSFPGGTPSSSTERNPTVTYNTAGTYNVTLTATNAYGSDDEIKNNYITVTQQPYCDSGSTDFSYEWIAGVVVGDLDNSSTGTPYSDYTNLSAHLNQGTSVNVSLTPGFASSAYTEYFKIWIDYNGDQDFEDAGEEVFSQSGTSAVSGSFTVPASSIIGTTRMRVSMNYNAVPPICGSFTYGEVEDYTVDISAPGTQYSITANSAGTGSVTLNPSGGIYNEGTEVTCSAVPGSGWQFDGWSGDLSGTTNPATLTMDADKNITANFSQVSVPTYTLTINTSGQGSVDANPPTGPYDDGTVVQLTVTPQIGWQFSGWSGDLSGTTNPANITMNTDKTVTATFTETGTIETVGNTSIYGSSTTTANRRAMPFTMPQNGILNSVSMYHTGGSGSMILAVYGGEGSPANRIALTATTVVSSTTGWQTVNLTSPVQVSGGSTIWLTWVYENNPGIYYTSGTPGRVDAGTDWSGGMPATFGSSTQSDYIYSIYANYTPTGGPSTNNVGITTIYGSTSTAASRRAMPFTMSENGTIESITMYHTGGSGNMILAIYNGTNAPANRIATTPITAISGTTGWQKIDLTTPVSVTSGNTIWLTWVYDTNPGIAYQTGSPGRYDAGVGWSGGMPATFGSGSQAAYLYSIYATYTQTIATTSNQALKD